MFSYLKAKYASIGLVYTTLSEKSIKLSLVLKVVGIQSDLNALKQILTHFGVAADWNIMVKSVEVIVVKGESHRKTPDDESWKFLTVNCRLTCVLNF